MARGMLCTGHVITKNNRHFGRFGLRKPTPDENTIGLFREKMTREGGIRGLFDAFNKQSQASGWLPMGGQIGDARNMPKVEKAKKRGPKPPPSAMTLTHHLR